MAPTLRLLIVAADPLVRSGLRRMLEESEQFSEVETIDPAEFLFLTGGDEQLPDVDALLWDLGWDTGELEGLEFQDLHLLVAALVTNEEQALRAWRAGAAVILERDGQLRSILPAIKAGLSGLVVLDSTIATSLIPETPRLPDDLKSPPTPRELEVLQLLAQGMTNRAIAQRLGISEHTVKFHINAILNKFNAQSRTEAVVTATKLGFILL